MNRDKVLGHVKYKKNLNLPIARRAQNPSVDISCAQSPSGDIITGEKIQNLADIYLGLDEDFKYNPFFNTQRQRVKQYNLINIGKNNGNYNNPRIVFCFTHRIDILRTKINFFQNNFILLTHNSDEEIKDNENVINILNCDKLVRWFTQNLYVENLIHPYNKLNILPIGIANTQWKHGKDFILSYLNNLKNGKDKNVYMSFDINTNKKERKDCYNSLYKKIEFLPSIDSLGNFERMSRFKYCICPIGNGVDTHRFWEALYLKVIPIVVRNTFYTLLENKVPMIILNNWDEFDLPKLPDYNTFNVDNITLADMNYYKDVIASDI